MVKARFHGNKLSTKNGTLNGQLLLGKPVNQRVLVDVDQESGARTMGQFVASMVTVDKHPDHHRLPWGVGALGGMGSRGVP